MIDYARTGAIATITLNRPDAGNRINARAAGELKRLCEEIQFDKEIRAVILSGQGKEMFCAGTDEEAFSLQDDPLQRMAELSVASAIARIDCPVLAAINGRCLGQGFELALACDLRICTEQAFFQMDQAQHSSMPWDGGTQRLARLVGRTKAMELLLLESVIDAHEAHRLGIVGQVVPLDELKKTVTDRAERIALQSPVSMAYAKEAVKQGLDLTLDQGLRLEADLYFLMQSTNDRKEGIRAFQAKRKPSFQGN